MKNKKTSNVITRLSDRRLKFFKSLYLALGILMICCGLLLLPVTAGISVVFIAIGIIEIFVYRKYRNELIRRKTAVNFTNPLTNSDPIDKIQKFNLEPNPAHIDDDIEPQFDDKKIPEYLNNENIRGKNSILTIKTEHHKIAGTSFRQVDIESLGDENDIYTWTKKEIIDYGMTDQKIYQLEFSPETVELVEEPDNKYDANAVKVIVDNVLIGYIKKGSCAHIKKLIREDRIKKITAEIYGGKYKLVSSDYDVMEDKEIFELEKDKTDYFASIYLDVKEK